MPHGSTTAKPFRGIIAYKEQAAGSSGHHSSCLGFFLLLLPLNRTVSSFQLVWQGLLARLVWHQTHPSARGLPSFVTEQKEGTVGLKNLLLKEQEGFSTTELCSFAFPAGAQHGLDLGKSAWPLSQAQEPQAQDSQWLKNIFCSMAIS